MAENGDMPENGDNQDQHDETGTDKPEEEAPPAASADTAKARRAETAPPDVTTNEVVHDTKSQTKMKGTTEQEKDKAEELFQKFDTAPQNGVLDKDEFKTAMKEMHHNFIDPNTNPTDDQLEEAFKKADTDGNKVVDLQEFKVAYSTLKKYKEDKNGVAAKSALVELFIHVAEKTVPGVSHAVTAAKTTSDIVSVKNPKLAEEQNLLNKAESDPDNKQAQQAAVAVAEEAADDAHFMFNMTICGIVTVLFLVFAYQMVWPLVFWIGYAQGESCDEPLETWILGSAILSTIHAIPFVCMMIVLIPLIMAFASGDPAQLATLGFSGGIDIEAIKGNMSGLDPRYQCVNCCAGLFSMIWFIYGCVIFSDVGGFDSSKTSNCQEVAPTLYNIMWWYFLCFVTIFTVMCALPCLLFPCLVCMGGTPTSTAMNH